MNRTMGKALLTTISLAVLASGANAATFDVRLDGPRDSVLMVSAADQGAQDFIAKMGDRGINFLGNPDMSEESKKAEFKKLLNDSFDMDTIGRFALGPTWRTATPAQQKEYLKLFNQMIVKVYSKRFSEYKGQKFEVRSSRAEGKDTMVASYIIPSDGPEVRVDWRVRNKGGKYKVVDIMVEGVSMAQTQRADFASVIQRGGGNIDALLAELRK